MTKGIQSSYNAWAQQYDHNVNATRDLEANALRSFLSKIKFEHCLELGCGTGKNTAWLVEQSSTVTSVDLSEEMLDVARQKINSAKVHFIQASILEPWSFAEKKYDLVSFSLVLEHIDNLEFIFSEAAKVTVEGGYIYIGELHPFKQYTGSKARFEIEGQVEIVECYNHNISDFVSAARKFGFTLEDLEEHFDNGDRTSIPRILTILFKRTSI